MIGKKEVLHALACMEQIIGDIREIIDRGGFVRDIPLPRPGPRYCWDCETTPGEGGGA
jgi:hypothetical protein